MVTTWAPVVSPEVARLILETMLPAIHYQAKTNQISPWPDLVDYLQALGAIVEAARPGTSRPTAERAVCDTAEMSTRAVAVLLGVGPRAIRGLAERGSLPGHQIGAGRHWRFDPADVERFATERTA